MWVKSPEKFLEVGKSSSFIEFKYSLNMFSVGSRAEFLLVCSFFNMRSDKLSELVGRNIIKCCAPSFSVTFVHPEETIQCVSITIGLIGSGSFVEQNLPLCVAVTCAQVM